MPPHDHGPGPVALAAVSAAERALSALSRREAAPIPVRQIAAAVARAPARAFALGDSENSSIDLSVRIAFYWCPHTRSSRTSSAEPQPATARSSAVVARSLMGAVVGRKVVMWRES